MNTSSGAEYAYFMDAFGGPPAFLFSWVSLRLTSRVVFASLNKHFNTHMSGGFCLLSLKILMPIRSFINSTTQNRIEEFMTECIASGIDTGTEAVSNGNYLPELRKIRGGTVRIGV